jgi:hypothetical protein
VTQRILVQAERADMPGAGVEFSEAIQVVIISEVGVFEITGITGVIEEENNSASFNHFRDSDVQVFKSP